MQPIVFVNIGWMKRYRGPSPTDRLNPGNFAYFKKKRRGGRDKIGHEQWNFKSVDGRMVGYVPRSARVTLTRLDADASGGKLNGVLVVFIARDPVVKALKVVGWYEDATVSKDNELRRTYGSIRVAASISAPAARCHVLPVTDRVIVVPTAQKVPGGVGQSPIWYAEEHPTIVAQVRRLVARKGRPAPAETAPPETHAKGPPRNLDPEKRLAVEKRAMDWAMRYFDNTEDVSRWNRGWDIESTSHRRITLIEVKGLMGTELSIELSPREFLKMGQHRDRYVVFVLNSALAKRPHARIFRYRLHGVRKPTMKWVSDDGEEVLKIEERTGAWCTLNSRKAPAANKARGQKAK